MKFLLTWSLSWTATSKPLSGSLPICVSRERFDLHEMKLPSERNFNVSRSLWFALEIIYLVLQGQACTALELPDSTLGPTSHSIILRIYDQNFNMRIANYNLKLTNFSTISGKNCYLTRTANWFYHWFVFIHNLFLFNHVFFHFQKLKLTLCRGKSVSERFPVCSMEIVHWIEWFTVSLGKVHAYRWDWNIKRKRKLYTRDSE